MTPKEHDRSSLRRARYWIFGLASALILWVLIVKPGPDPQYLALNAACTERYSRAHSRGDSLLVDAWIPEPGLQTRRMRFLRCRDLPR